MQKLVDRAIVRVFAGAVPLGMGEGVEDVPTLEVFLPTGGRSVGASCVVCPGGGYGSSAEHEVTPPGLWLASIGVTAFVLRYRMCPPYGYPAPMLDAMRAIRVVRSGARVWGLDRGKIGILGFSAGGHLAATVSTLFEEGKGDSEDAVERESSRPDGTILIYPVITMGEFGHGGSRENLLGKEAGAELVKRMSIEKQVSGRNPPAFLVHSTEDGPVPVRNSDEYAGALGRHGIPYEYVRGAYGDHGFGMQGFWTGRAEGWLRGMGWVG